MRLKSAIYGIMVQDPGFKGMRLRALHFILSSNSYVMMEKANSRFRIFLMVFMMVFCLTGSLYSISQGKKAAKDHVNTIAQQNQERYRKR